MKILSISSVSHNKKLGSIRNTTSYQCGWWSLSPPRRRSGRIPWSYPAGRCDPTPTLSVHSRSPWLLPPPCPALFNGTMCGKRHSPLWWSLGKKKENFTSLALSQPPQSFYSHHDLGSKTQHQNDEPGDKLWMCSKLEKDSVLTKKRTEVRFCASFLPYNVLKC